MRSIALMVAFALALITPAVVQKASIEAANAYKLRDPIKAGVAEKLFRLQMTSRYGRQAKTSDAASNSRLLAGL